MGNVFKIRKLKYVIGWSVFLIDISFIFFLALISYLLLKSLEVQIHSIGLQNEKLVLVTGITILVILKIKPEWEIKRYSVSFDFFKTVWLYISAFLVFPGLNGIVRFVPDQSVYLSSVLFLFFFVFLIFKMAPEFFKEVYVRIIPQVWNMPRLGLE